MARKINTPRSDEPIRINVCAWPDEVHRITWGIDPETAQVMRLMCMEHGLPYEAYKMHCLQAAQELAKAAGLLEFRDNGQIIFPHGAVQIPLTTECVPLEVNVERIRREWRPAPPRPPQEMFAPPARRPRRRR